jgi:beta-fructofuranosidase
VGAALLVVLAGAATGQESLRDKTLVVWAQTADLNQQGGSALTIDDLSGGFDAIVLGEIEPARWMPGSEVYARTPQAQGDWPAETVVDEFVQIAIVYEGRRITMLRNGDPYASYEMDTQPREFGPQSVVMFGKRHLEAGTGESFRGSILDARIYDSSLSPDEITALVPGATDDDPWAWWYFGDGRVAERTGRYGKLESVGDVRVSDGALVLGGDGATLIVYPAGTAERSWQPGQPVPRPVVEGARELREHLLADPHRPGYHFVVPEDHGLPGDPNGAVYYNGRYHLMYLFHNGEAFEYGHVSSTDLVHWRHHPRSIRADKGDEGIFSGGGFVDPSGRAWVTYWGLGGPAGRGLCVAYSDDEHLDTWIKPENHSVVPSTHFGYTVEEGADGEEIVYGSADPSNIWMKDGRYYMLAGNLPVLNRYGKELGIEEHQGDTAYLFVSDDLLEWEYLHPFYESRRAWTRADEDNMCPVFLPLPSSPEGGEPSGKHLLLFISHNLGCQYYIGEYDEAADKFIPETHGRMTWVDNAYFAPEALIDDRGRLIMWAWLTANPPEDYIRAQGWQGVYGLPRLLWLREDGSLGMRPVDELAMLRQEEMTWTDLTLRPGEPLELPGLAGELMELEMVVQPGDASRVGASVLRSEDGAERTALFVDAAEGALEVDTTESSQGFGREVVESAPFALPDGEPLALRIFIDRGVVEVYANDRQGVARQVYPTLGGEGIQLFAEGAAAEVVTLRAWRLMPSNPY